MANTDDIAFGIVEPYLIVGPPLTEIVEAVDDSVEAAPESTYEDVAILVRKTLDELARTFNISN